VSADLAEGILERWYRQQAKAVVSGALELYRERMGVTYESLVIKDQKTRWGSCSSKGNLNFSWRLILAPKSVLDYVVVHELAHLREMNHSSRFWRIVEEYYGEYKAAERWLKENGVGLRI
jgi:predicted metal-dependent hydrolase